MKNEVLSLTKYIDKYFNGSIQEFADSCEKHKQHIWRQCQSDSYIVVNHDVCQIKYSATGF